MRLTNNKSNKICIQAVTFSDSPSSRTVSPGHPVRAPLRDPRGAVVLVLGDESHPATRAGHHCGDDVGDYYRAVDLSHPATRAGHHCGITGRDGYSYPTGVSPGLAAGHHCRVLRELPDASQYDTLDKAARWTESERQLAE